MRIFIERAVLSKLTRLEESSPHKGQSQSFFLCASTFFFGFRSGGVSSAAAIVCSKLSGIFSPFLCGDIDLLSCLFGNPYHLRFLLVIQANLVYPPFSGYVRRERLAAAA
jgi:hypothetical protein